MVVLVLARDNGSSNSDFAAVGLLVAVVAVVFVVVLFFGTAVGFGTALGGSLNAAAFGRRIDASSCSRSNAGEKAVVDFMRDCEAVGPNGELGGEFEKSEEEDEEARKCEEESVGVDSSDGDGERRPVKRSLLFALDTVASVFVFETVRVEVEAVGVPAPVASVVGVAELVDWVGLRSGSVKELLSASPLFATPPVTFLFFALSTGVTIFG